MTAEVLSAVFVTALVGLVAAAAKGTRAGYLGLTIIGFVIGIADLLKHGLEILSPGAWRSGPVSEGLAIGLTLAALLTAWTSSAAFRRSRGNQLGGGTDE